MALRPWARRLQAEAELLPETLATIRVAADNIHRVSEDLTEVVATLKRVTSALDAAGLAEASDIIQKSSEAMRLTSKDMAAAQKAFADVNDAFLKSLSRLPGGELFTRFRPPR